MKTETIKKLKQLKPCYDALEWVEKQPSRKSAWDNCERGDWMLWLLGKRSGEVGSKSRKKLVWTACQCARLSLPYVEKGEERPLKAIETAEKYTKGDATLDEVRKAGDAAYAYDADADAYAAYAAAYAAYAAAYAANAAYAAAYAANAAYDAAYAAAAYAADADAYAAADAYTKSLKKCADIVRENYPNPPKLTQ